MSNQKILGIAIENETKNDILEKIVLYIDHPIDFFHIVSLNPEIFCIVQDSQTFKKVIETAQIRIIDGVGVVAAAKLLNIPIGQRLTGVDLMEELMKVASERRLRVLLIGGNGNLALQLTECYNKTYPEASFFGTKGFKNVKNPKEEETEALFRIVTDVKPHIIFVAFGSPEQELWLYQNKERLDGIVCMGVGGSFGFAAGSVPRAPGFIQRIGLEWLFRLIVQPWRWRRQLRLFKFCFLILKQRFTCIISNQINQ